MASQIPIMHTPRQSLFSRQSSSPTHQFNEQDRNMNLNRRSNMKKMDIFDPFDELDQLMSTPSQQVHWLNRPETLRRKDQQPDVPRRYRITLDARGFSHESLNTEFKETKTGQSVLLISGLEEDGDRSSDDFTRKELKRSFTLPKNIVLNKMVSWLTPDGKLIIEFPVQKKQESTTTGSDRIASILPHVANTVSGDKELHVRLPVPESIDINKIHVSLKDHDLIMCVEDEKVSKDMSVRIHLFDRVTLPEHCDWANMKCVKEKDHLLVTAPLTSRVTKPMSHEIQVQATTGSETTPTSSKSKKKSGKKNITSSI